MSYAISETMPAAQALGAGINPMKRPIIFLDVDGVLNNHGTTTRNAHHFIGLDPLLVERFKRLRQKTNAEVVLSSTWRLYPALYAEAEKAVGPFLGRTPDLPGTPVGALIQPATRGQEIQSWIHQNHFTGRFCIIDDMPPMCFHPHEAKLIRTSMSHGLTAEAAAKAETMLIGPTIVC